MTVQSRSAYHREGRHHGPEVVGPCSQDDTVALATRGPGLGWLLQGFLDPCGESQQQACQGPSSGGLCADGPSYARCHHIQEASLAGEAHHCPEWGAAVCWGWSYTLCHLPPRFRVCTPGGWRCQEAPRSSDQVGSLLSSLALGVCYHRVNLLPVFLGLFFLLTEAFNLETVEMAEAPM